MKKVKTHLTKIKRVKSVLSKNIHPRIRTLTNHDLVNIKRYYGHLISLFLLASLLCIFITVCVLFVLAKSYEKSVVHSREVAKQYYYWKQITAAHPNFPDGFLQAARYAEFLGENEEALSLVEKAMMIDPNSQEAIDLKERIIKKR